MTVWPQKIIIRCYRLDYSHHRAGVTWTQGTTLTPHTSHLTPKQEHPSGVLGVENEICTLTAGPAWSMIWDWEVKLMNGLAVFCLESYWDQNFINCNSRQTDNLRGGQATNNINILLSLLGKWWHHGTTLHPPSSWCLPYSSYWTASTYTYSVRVDHNAMLS